MGHEVKVKTEAEAQAEEPGFFRKYWLYILLAFLVLPNLLGDAGG